MSGISEMQLTNTSEQQIQKINTARLCQTIKAMTARSYEKTFQGLDEKQVVAAFDMCIGDLSREQIQIGLNSIRDNGYCPDPAMFRKWCLGIKGFINDVDPVKDSYKGKYDAISNIEAWLSNPSTLITNAEREAYNRVYGMFQKLEWADNYERTKFYAYEAFKDSYVDVVKGLVERGEGQSIWDAKSVIEKKREPIVGFGQNYLKTTKDISAWYVCKTGFKSVDIEIKKEEIRNYAILKRISFGDAESKMLLIEIKKIKWVVEK